MEAVRTSETSVDNLFTRQYNPEDSSELQFALIYTFLVSIHGFHFREYSLLGLHTTSLHTQVCSKEADKLPKGTQLPKPQKFKDLIEFLC
jgi:hypothetical protein